MPMFTTLRIRLPVWPVNAPLRSRVEKSAIAEALHEKVWPFLNTGGCAPIIDSTFPLAEVAAAHRHLESGAHVGKIVLTLT